MVEDAADLEDDLVLLREPLEQLAERSQRIGEMYDFETKERTFGLPKVNANEDSTLEAKLVGMQELVQYRIDHSGAYFRFFLTFFFFAAYSGGPILPQERIAKPCGSSVKTWVHMFQGAVSVRAWRIEPAPTLSAAFQRPP